MKKRTQPRQTTALVLGLTAGVLLAACSGPEPTPWVEEQYQEHAADIKKIFGNEVKEDSEQTYVASKVDWSTKGEGPEYGWKHKYELTLKTTTEKTLKRTYLDGDEPILNFAVNKYPPGLSAEYLGLVPTWGSFVLGEKVGDRIDVTRHFGDSVDRKFKDGKLKVNEDGSLVLTYIYRVSACQDVANPTVHCISPTWEFTLKKKE